MEHQKVTRLDQQCAKGRASRRPCWVRLPQLAELQRQPSVPWLTPLYCGVDLELGKDLFYPGRFQLTIGHHCPRPGWWESGWKTQNLTAWAGATQQNP